MLCHEKCNDMPWSMRDGNLISLQWWLKVGERANFLIIPSSRNENAFNHDLQASKMNIYASWEGWLARMAKNIELNEKKIGGRRSVDKRIGHLDDFDMKWIIEYPEFPLCSFHHAPWSPNKFRCHSHCSSERGPLYSDRERNI
jgi:hypothetical protein